MAELNVTLQELRGTYKEFTAKNPILKNGQLAVVTIETGDSVGGFIAPSTGLKCGDGVTAFNDLGWLAGREQLINTGSVASNAILHKQNQELYMTQSEFDKLDKTTLPVGTEINIVDQIQKSDLSTEIQKSLTNADTALTNANTANTTANTALTTANNALPKTGGTVTGDVTFCQNTLTVDQGGISVNNGSLTLDGQEVTTQYYVDQEIAKVKSGYDYTFSDLTSLKALLNKQTTTDSLKGKHILYTGSWEDYGTDVGGAQTEGILDFHGADVTHEHHYSYTAGSGDHIYGSLTNIGTLYGYKWTGDYGEDICPWITVQAETIRGIGCGTGVTPTADFIYDSHVGTCISKTGTTSAPFGTIANCLFDGDIIVYNYSSVINCSTTSADGATTFTNCTYVGKQLEASQIGSSGGSGEEYDYTFTNYSDLQTFLSGYTDANALSGKHILFTGELGASLDFHNADLTYEHHYDLPNAYCSYGGTNSGTLSNINTFYGDKWTATFGDTYSYFGTTISANTIRGLGYGAFPTIIADYVYNACVGRCISKTGTNSSPYGTIFNSVFYESASIKNYQSVLNCSTFNSEGKLTVIGLSPVIGKELKASQLLSSGGSSAKWHNDDSGATPSNPVQFIKIHCSSWSMNYCSSALTADITLAITPSTYGCSASTMAYAVDAGQMYCFIVNFDTNSTGMIESGTLSVYHAYSNSNNYSLLTYAQWASGHWMADDQSTDLYTEMQYYY